MKFAIGESVTCDLQTLVDTRLLVQANSGGGKSWCLRRILEQTHGKVQHIVIDPEGEFASLRERFDYVLAAKNGADTAADPRSAQLLAERLLELGVSAILDIYELKHHDRIRFVKAFLDALVNAPKRLWHPALIVLDEAHVFCPQQGEAESAGSVIDMATRGRKRGFCLVPATQRLSKLHKDAAAECNNKLIGRTGLDVDVKRAADELGFPKERWRELRELEGGEFFAFGPAISRAVTRVKVGGIQTTHPKAGSRHEFVVPPVTEKIRMLLPKLSDLPAEVEAREKTEADLKRENANLKRELSQRPTVAPEVQRIEVPIVSSSAIETLNVSLERLESFHNAQAEAFSQVWTAITELRKEVQAAARQPAPRHDVRTVRPVAQSIAHRPIARAPVASRSVAVGEGSVRDSGQRKVLSALAQYQDGRTKRQVAVLCGYAMKGGRFNNILGSLRSGGFVKGSDVLMITDEGLDALGSYDPLPHGDELLQHWRGQMGAGEAAVLDAIVAAYPRGVTKEHVAETVGYEARGGRFNNILGRLRTLQFIEGRGELKASEDLFD